MDITDWSQEAPMLAITCKLFMCCEFVFSYFSLFPPGEVNVVAEKVTHPLLCHLALQTLQQVCKPLKGLGLRTQPVEVDLTQKTLKGRSQTSAGWDMMGRV